MSVSDELRKPLDPGRVKKREGSGGKQLSYLEGHFVIRRANEIFGFGGWDCEILEIVHLGTESVTNKYGKEGFRVAYRATVRVKADVDGITGTYSDTGYGDGQEYTGSQLTPHELASKEAVTDAKKRALVHLGDQMGLSLYNKDAPEHSGKWAEGAVPANAPHVALTPVTPKPTELSWAGLRDGFAKLGVTNGGDWMNAVSVYMYTVPVSGLTPGVKKELLPRMNMLLRAVEAAQTGPEASIGFLENPDLSVQRAVAQVFDGMIVDPPKSIQEHLIESGEKNA